MVYMAVMNRGRPATPPTEGAAFLDAIEHRAWEVDFLGEGHAQSLDDPCLARAVQSTYPDRGVEIRVEPPAGEPAPSFAALNVGKARRTFGYAPRTLAEGLAEQLARNGFASISEAVG